MSPDVQDVIQYEAGRRFLQELKESSPDLLVVDFAADVRHGCVRFQTGDILTRNRWGIVKTDYFKCSDHRDLVPGTLEYFRLWCDSVTELGRLVRESVPSCRIVLHSARNCFSYRQTDGQLIPFVSPETLARQNRWWAMLDLFFGENVADFKLRAFSDETVSYADHPWGPWPLHYEMSYHQASIKELSLMNVVTPSNSRTRDAVT